MKDLHLIGAGGLGREIQAMLPQLGYRQGGLYDHEPSRGYPHPDSLPPEASAALCIGESHTRYQAWRLLPAGLIFPVLRHPSSLLLQPESITLGKGSIITAGCTLTCDIKIEPFCLINLHCTIGHDVCLGAFCSLMPSVNLGGGVICEEQVYLGTGASVLPLVRIGRGAKVGAGAVVTRDVAPHSTVVGVPARPLN